jgi:O-antigen/teichoic acid export membrane protein
MLRELLKDLTKYSPSLIVPIIVEIIALPIITRLFPPGEYGNYILVKSSASILTIITTAWFSSSFARYFPQYQLSRQRDLFVGTIIKLLILFVGSIFLLSSLALLFIPWNMSSTLYSLSWVGLLLFLVNSCSDVFIKILRAERQALKYTLFQVWNSVMGLVIGLVLVMLFDLDIKGLLWGAIISTTISLPLLWKVAAGSPTLKGIRVFSSVTGEVAKFGIPATGIYLLTWILDMSDRYIIGLFRGSLEVGIYSASYAISAKGMSFIVSLFLLAGHPIVYSIFENKGLDETKKFMPKLARFYLIISVPAVIGLSVLAQSINAVLVAPEYHSGYVVIPWVAAGVFFMGISNIFSLNLGIYKKMNLLLVCYLAGGILNFGLNLVFVPIFGYIAAAITTFISYIATTLFTYFFAARYFKWHFPITSLIRIVGSSLIMGILVYSLNSKPSFLHIIWGVFIGVMIYFALVFLLRETNFDEIKALLKI